ncbi:TIGR00153 family protein [Desulfofustis limnaeus]|uniref:Phosphate transport regulator n=1 Tax=Desulfofustis limnaeus TaxID=2740163 RepID=A0ABN6M9L3_9BACT|nr:TIGR00153 family protein [Desulfofustis limnaeus]BDD87807.1 phosphate transport regulator [Desulfofustis limnaeus]
MDIKSTTPFAGLFRTSPFKPVQQHMRLVFSCICYIPPLLDALYRKDYEQVKEFADEIIKLESEADEIKQAFRLTMPNTLLLPVDRKDLLNLISDQDSIADLAEDIAKVLLYRDMEVPDPLKGVLDELLEGTMEISVAAKDLIEQLDELLQVGFRGREQEKVSQMISGVRRSEHNIDTIIHRIKRTLFEHEQRLDPISVIFWYQLIDLLGGISDQAENVADRLLLFLSK